MNIKDFGQISRKPSDIVLVGRRVAGQVLPQGTQICFKMQDASWATGVAKLSHEGLGQNRRYLAPTQVQMSQGASQHINKPAIKGMSNPSGCVLPFCDTVEILVGVGTEPLGLRSSNRPSRKPSSSAPSEETRDTITSQRAVKGKDNRNMRQRRARGLGIPFARLCPDGGAKGVAVFGVRSMQLTIGRNLTAVRVHSTKPGKTIGTCSCGLALRLGDD